jgi:hypothetical protein
VQNEPSKEFFDNTLGNLSVGFGHFSKTLTTDRYVLVPPKSDPCFKWTMLEDGSSILDDSVDRSDYFPDWVWEK